MKVTIGSNIIIEDNTPDINKWCKDNLVIDNPEFTKKLRMGFWIGNTPEKLHLYSRLGNKLYLPYGVLERIRPLLDGAEIKADKGRIRMGCLNLSYKPIPLYDYQAEAVRVLKSVRGGILQAPAGSGKTQIGIALAERWGKKTLWITHTKDLLNQSKARAELYIKPEYIGTITEGKVDISEGITFATIQTMARLDLQSLKYEWETIIVDECHRVAGSPTSMTQYYKVLNSLAALYKYGLSATLHRSDGMIVATHALLGDTVHTITSEEVGERVVKVGIKPIETGVKLHSSCLNTDGTLNYTALITYLAANEKRNLLIVDKLIKDKDKSSIILSDRLLHLEELMGMLPDDMKDDAVMISGKMTSKVGKLAREQALEDMRQGRKKYLFATYSLTKEGLDIPCLERLYMATPQKDYAVVTQSIGRIARAYEGKDEPIAIDLIDDIGYLVRAYRKRCTTYRKNGCYFVEA